MYALNPQISLGGGDDGVGDFGDAEFARPGLLRDAGGVDADLDVSRRRLRVLRDADGVRARKNLRVLEGVGATLLLHLRGLHCRTQSVIWLHGFPFSSSRRELYHTLGSDVNGEN